MAFSIENISLFTYGIVFFSGIFICFTPCVYPMLPIVISYIGGSELRTRKEVFMRSLSYVLGLACVYSLLGAIISFSGGIFGRFQNNFWLNVIVGNIFILMGLFMLDVFTFPQFNFIRGGILKNTSGWGGAFLVGAVSGMVIGPCTTPVLGAILTYVATKQNLVIGATLLFTYALGMGFPLLILGIFVGLLKKLPKSGSWMLRMKKIFGLLLIITGEYFLIGLR